MKTSLLITALAGITLAGTASAAITNPGAANAYQSTDGDWLTNTTDDIDGNGLGTDGYLFFGDFDGVAANNQPFTHNVQSLPSYVSSVAAGADFLSVVGQFAGAGEIDDPTLIGTANEGDDSLGGTLVARNGTGLPAGDFIDDAMSFTISGLAAGTTVRVGVLSGVEGTNDGRWDPTSITLTDGSDTVTIGDHDTAPLPTGDTDSTGDNVGWVFFDIDADGTYTLGGTKTFGAGGNQGIGFGGLTFDSVPEPSSLALLGLGGLMMARRRRA